MQLGENVSALRAHLTSRRPAPAHATVRRRPEAPANGMPLKTAIDVFRPSTPDSCPCFNAQRLFQERVCAVLLPAEGPIVGPRHKSAAHVDHRDDSVRFIEAPSSMPRVRTRPQRAACNPIRAPVWFWTS